MQFLTLNRLPFHLIEHPTFHTLIRSARLAPSPPMIPSATTIRRRLRDIIQDKQRSTLKTLPPESKISIALDCWTSPYNQAFMAITGYFVNANWVYQEVLLGFKPLYGSHTGANLSAVLLETLTHHNIQNRVFGITTDNATNNKTLVDTIQQALSSETTVIRIPCLAHVIQLCLNQLLDRLKAVPQNDAAETKWTDRQSSAAKANAKQQKHEISGTLNKVRYLAIYIHASPQRRETFLQLQPKEPRLVPIQDVRTRWNSTFLMLRRAKRLRSYFISFCEQYDCKEMLLNNEEWRQIDYLLCITEPFFDYTTELSKTKEVTTHLVFKLYNALFEHLEKSIGQLKKKRIPWKKQMLQSLEAGRQKLGGYYSQTDGVKGHIFAICTMVAPDSKFQFFQTDDWEQQWRVAYRKSFQSALLPYQQRLARDQASPTPQASSRPTSKLNKMLSGSKTIAKPVGDEAAQYLDSGQSCSLTLS